MSPCEIKPEAFCEWLCSHEMVVFERPASTFASPIARWLSDVSGHLYGVDGCMYGLALEEARCWKPLPCWARMLVARLEACATHSLSGCEVFALLAGVEVALVPMGAGRQAVYA